MSLIFIDNIRAIMEQESMSAAAFAAKIGEKTSRVNDVLQGKQRPPFDMLEKILSTFDVDARWLILGDNSQIRNISNNSDEFALIPMYDVEVSAGSGAVAYGEIEPTHRLAFRRDWLASRGLYEKDLHVVIARGDSMEPTIHGKDTLLIDTSKSTPRDGHIYVIRSGDTLWVKRIQRQFDKSLLLISDNTAYPPLPLNLAEHPDIQVIGQVVNVSKELN